MRSMVYAMFMASGHPPDTAFGRRAPRDEYGLNGRAALAGTPSTNSALGLPA
jgi:hypothetical protein